MNFVLVWSGRGGLWWKKVSRKGSIYLHSIVSVCVCFFVCMCVCTLTGYQDHQEQGCRVFARPIMFCTVDNVSETRRMFPPFSISPSHCPVCRVVLFLSLSCLSDVYLCQFVLMSEAYVVMPRLIFGEVRSKEAQRIKGRILYVLLWISFPLAAVIWDTVSIRHILAASSTSSSHCFLYSFPTRIYFFFSTLSSLP